MRRRVVHRRRLVLLPAQDAARRAGLRRAARHLHDVQQHRRRRWCATAPRARSRRPSASTCCEQARDREPRAVRRERPREGQLHLQLLRLLLRGADRRAPVRLPPPGPHHQLSPGDRPRALQRLRQVRGCLPGRGDGARVGQRPGEAATEDSPPGRRGVPGLRRVRRGVRASSGLRLRVAAARVITPLNSTHKAVLMAIERGKLQNLIFDNQALLSHRALAAILGVDPAAAARPPRHGFQATEVPLPRAAHRTIRLSRSGSRLRLTLTEPSPHVRITNRPR